MLSTSAENTIRATSTKKNKMDKRSYTNDVSQMLNARINLGDSLKDLVEEWAQNHCLSVIFSGFNTNISQKQLLPCTIFCTMVC